MINNFLTELTKNILSKKRNITHTEANELVVSPIYDLLYCANLIRTKFLGNKIKLCSIINSKSGRCSEDCKFCAQSSDYDTGINCFPLVDRNKIKRAEKEAQRNKAYCLGIVISGKEANDKELNEICKYIKNMKIVEPHASLGILTEQKAKMLKNASLKMYHHNIETSKRFFQKICSTHTYNDRIKTIKIAKKYFKTCSGGIFGMGETWQDRIDMAFTLKDLDVNNVPLNFLNPIKGTPFESRRLLRALDVLRIIAMFRFILPDKNIMTAGGREKNLRGLQSWMFYAGANATLTGNYLTTTGKYPKEDIEMIKDLGLSIK